MLHECTSCWMTFLRRRRCGPKPGKPLAYTNANKLSYSSSISSPTNRICKTSSCFSSLPSTILHVQGILSLVLMVADHSPQWPTRMSRIQKAFFCLFITRMRPMEIMARIFTVRTVAARCKHPFALRHSLPQEETMSRTKEITKERTKGEQRAYRTKERTKEGTPPTPCLRMP